MKWGEVAGITVILLAIALFEWPRMNSNQRKEKAAFATLSFIGWVLAVLLIFQPEMPGPTQLVEFIYKPFGKLLEK
jgi:multisubunit Na+/H+ antiporter MnhB subunit